MMARYSNQRQAPVKLPSGDSPSDRRRVCGTEFIQEDFKVIRVSAENQQYSCLPYNRKGLFKISLHRGATRIYYADKTVQIENQAILFSRPNMVYRFEPIGKQHPGYLCVFTESFFDQFVDINDYPLFKLGASPLTEITKSQMDCFWERFQKMEDELQLDFAYKYEAVRVLVVQLILDTLKLRPMLDLKPQESNSAIRLSGNFHELLEGQFPILNPAHRMHLRHPAEFADALFVHVNHLNRSLREVAEKSTSQLIVNRICKEAKILLQNTDWNIGEIGWCLGFEDLSHFIKVFKKSAGTTPNKFRQVLGGERSPIFS